MAATATQDDDLIIFNDEVEDDTSTSSEDTSSTQTQDDTSSTDEKSDTEETNREDNNQGDSELISFNLEETDDQNIQEEQNTQTTEDTVQENNEEIISFESEETPVQEGVSSETEIGNITLEPTSTPEEIKDELIDIQDNIESSNLTSFEDMGIDLNKLGDKEGKNLDGIDIKATDEEAEINLEISDSSEEMVEENKTPNLDVDLDSIGDFAAGFSDSDIDESTLKGILDSTIQKLNTREEVATQQIEEQEAEEAEVKGEIEHLKGKQSDIKEKIKEVEFEKKKIVEIREGIEKMKEAS